MEYIFTIAYLYIFIFLVVCLFAIAWYRWAIWRPVLYKSALTSYMVKKSLAKKWHFSQVILYFLRLLVLLLMVLLVSRPQGVDPKSKVKVDGVDIALVLDVSNSMQMFDDVSDKRTRIEIAKKEAVKFIDRRENDPIGLVIFGRHAVSRCPLTLDKSILRKIVDDTQIGEIDPNGTVLSIAMMTAVNRLKRSLAKSKVMIVLTDGQPTPGDIDPKMVIDVAKKLEIKIYTVGIGAIDGGYFDHPLLGVIRTGETFNQKLLEQIANDTGGRFFQAKNAKDMHQIYNVIDQLEKTIHQTPMFTIKHEYFAVFIILISLLLLLELFLSYFVWFGI